MSRNPLSPAAPPPLEDEDLLTESLLRLPPQPSSLPRASAVCKRWRRLVSMPGFLRHFGAHHRRNPPLLGFFRGTDFLPTMESPNRLPYGCFSFQLDDGDELILLLRTLGCRHGLVLIFLPKRFHVLVWDPVTSHQHLIAITPGFDPLDLDGHHLRGAVLRPAGDVHHFQVVMVGTLKQQAIAQVYSSKTGLWSNLISAPLPPKESSSTTILPAMTDSWVGDVLVGGSLYWLLGKSNILKFDLDRQRLAVLPLPVGESNCEFLVMRADGGGLGCLVLSKFSAQLWKRKANCSDGVASWVLGRTIELDKLLCLDTEMIAPLKIAGFAEENSVVILQTDIWCRFAIQLQSLQFNKFFDIKFRCCYHPFETVYTPVIGGGHDGAELLGKT